MDLQVAQSSTHSAEAGDGGGPGQHVKVLKAMTRARAAQSPSTGTSGSNGNGSLRKSGRKRSIKPEVALILNRNTCTSPRSTIKPPLPLPLAMKKSTSAEQSKAMEYRQTSPQQLREMSRTELLAELDKPRQEDQNRIVQLEGQLHVAKTDAELQREIIKKYRQNWKTMTGEVNEGVLWYVPRKFVTASSGPAAGKK